MSYKLALQVQVLVTFSEHVVPVQNILLSSEFPRYPAQKQSTMKLTKTAAVKLSEHIHIACLLSTSLASCNLIKWIQAFCSRHYTQHQQ